MKPDRFRFLNHPRFKAFPRSIQQAALEGNTAKVKDYLSAASKKGHNTKRILRKSDISNIKLSPSEAKALKAMQAKFEKKSEVKRKRKNMPQVDLDKLEDKYNPEEKLIALGGVKPSQHDYNSEKVDRIKKDLKDKDPEKLKPIIVSKDMHILDGHHRHRGASSVYGKEQKVRMYIIPHKRKKALDLLEDYT